MQKKSMYVCIALNIFVIHVLFSFSGRKPSEVNATYTILPIKAQIPRNINKLKLKISFNLARQMSELGNLDRFFDYSKYLPR